MSIAIIPARGGSKRIPGKNVKQFCGRPMMAWSIDAALASGCFDRVVVSTDDPSIAELAISLGTEVPFLRPRHLADDHTPTVAVIAHALEWLSREGPLPVSACCLYPTAPFVGVDDLRAGFRLLENSAADYVLTVAPFPTPIERALRLDGDGWVSMCQPQNRDVRTQDLLPAYHDAGQFYWGRTEAWTSVRAILSGNSRALVLPRHRVCDIDTPEDWVTAEYLFRATRMESYNEYSRSR